MQTLGLNIHAQELEAGPQTHYISVPEAIEAMRAGNMVLICDDEERENEADLCLAAQFVTPEAINFMLRSARGLICTSLSAERLAALKLPMLDQSDQPLQGTAFTSSVDARSGTTTGISAHDRATTIRALVNPATQPSDLARPGHVFPLMARPQGTLERRGHTEASVDLARLAGLEPAAVICEVLNDEGEAARGEELHALARQWGIGIVTVDAIARYRSQEQVRLIATTRLPIGNSNFLLRDYLEIASDQHCLTFILGDLATDRQEPPLLRLHSACTTGDIFGSQRCDCQAQLHTSLQRIAEAGRGILIYLPQEGRGIGLSAKIQAYALQDQGYDTISANELLGYPVDARRYDSALAILRDLSLTHVRLLTNNPRKIQALNEGGIQVERVSLEIEPTPENQSYLATKQQRLGHLLQLSTSHDANQEGTIL
ncbi:3,4-dihydroxy-2-butanone-4-phosphate synthase [Ktedonobacter racemifer]|uniref:Multifunctional fusion protein n=1 Tax=Ktedonobacter racemifer DSM 44963 TaxID=485913 RepID=D6U4K4_KTERA|nr:3,4-dihydroxy-2-butanone-4-phosphate synthase [Ktedonobacter racemifer]EFH81434.1 3,4-dihydroxy-2-butanone 4-phosphate synthase [Ktedonobacter racemifer DSM 44963]